LLQWMGLCYYHCG